MRRAVTRRRPPGEAFAGFFAGSGSAMYLAMSRQNPGRGKEKLVRAGGGCAGVVCVGLALRT